MACTLDLTGLLPTCSADANVTIKLVAATAVLQRASINTTDLTASIDRRNKSVSFIVPAGRNTVILVLLPPPVSEQMKVVEDCGGGNTQEIISFGLGIHASISFDIIAS